MASSNNNISAVHFSLIFFVMLSIILGVMFYLSYDDARKLRDGSTKNENEARKMKAERDSALDRIAKFQGRVGYTGRLGDSADEDGTANQALRNHLRDLGDDTRTLKTMVNWELLEKKRNKTVFDSNLAALKKKEQQLEQAKRTAESQVVQLQDDLKKEKERVEKIDKDREEAVAAKQKMIEDLQATTRQLTTQIDDLKVAQQEAIAKLEKKVSDLQTTVAVKQKQIDELQNVTFETPDGTVRWVDHSTRLVWISLGTADKLPNRMTFSVYSKAHHGIARGREGIKGSIEITRIVGAHMAEARILKNDLFDPIRAGDPIYTPLWSPGLTESFAFSGEFDLDGDGTSDRELLHRMVRAAGAKISNEVDDKGDRQGTGLTHEDKFLVVGSIPDPSEAPPGSDERKRRQKISAADKVIQDEAKNKGVRIIRKADFLALVGFKSNSRLWRPGEASKRKLKAGSQSTTTDQYVGRRQSSGQTSGIYTKRGRARGQRTSSGQTSKIFGGK
ncbi:MAG: hypothetical protein ACE5KM_12030 [Planctomycetaceae bacterium]